MEPIGPNRARVLLTRRFWTAVALAVAVAGLGASEDHVGGHVFTGGWIAGLRWVELALCSVAVFWCGWPLLVRLRTRALHGPTLSALAGLGIYAYGLLAMLAPELWPHAWRDAFGLVAVRFDLAAGLIAFALLAELVRTRKGGEAAR